MQSAVVCSFRARLRRAGYTEISIKRKKFIDQEVYLVIARDPLFGVKDSRYMEILDMHRWR